MKNKILELGRELLIDEGIRTVCPFCKAEHEDSFSIRRINGGLLFHCFRASCSKNGFVGSLPPKTVPGRGRTGEDTRKGANKLHPFQGKLQGLTPEIFEQGLQSSGVVLSRFASQGVRYCPELQRLYFPIFNERGVQIAELFRAINNRIKPKNLKVRLVENVPLIYFPLHQKVEKVLVLTEDQISAIKASEIVPTAALLGTNLNEDGLRLFHKLGLEEIILMLDGDKAGYIATVELADKLKPFFTVRQIFLKKGFDPKDLSYDELRRLIELH
jgi:hypothetical protein